MSLSVCAEVEYCDSTVHGHLCGAQSLSRRLYGRMRTQGKPRHPSSPAALLLPSFSLSFSSSPYLSPFPCLLSPSSLSGVSVAGSQQLSSSHQQSCTSSLSRPGRLHCQGLPRAPRVLIQSYYNAVFVVVKYRGHFSSIHSLWERQ